MRLESFGKEMMCGAALALAVWSGIVSRPVQAESGAVLLEGRVYRSPYTRCSEVGRWCSKRGAKPVEGLMICANAFDGPEGEPHETVCDLTDKRGRYRLRLKPGFHWVGNAAVGGSMLVRAGAGLRRGPNFNTRFRGVHF